MPETTYRKYSSEISGFYIPADTDPVNARTAFVLAPRFGDPESFVITDAWDLSRPGVYCFLPHLPDQDKIFDFVRVVQATYLREYRSRRYLIWFDDPNTVGASRTMQSLIANSELLAPVSFPFHNADVQLSAQCTLGLNDAKDGFQLSANTGTIRLTQPASAAGETSQTQLDVPIATLEIQLAADIQGIVNFDVTLNEPDLDDLDVGLRFFWPQPASTAGPEDDRAVDSLRYPIFRLAAADQTLPLRASLDVYSLDDDQRTFYAFTDDTARSSYYLSNLGHRFSLAAETDGRLLFTPKPVTLSEPATQFYLAPAGTFDLSVEPGQREGVSTDDFMCGTSGVEYLKLTRESANRLTYTPKQSAFAEGFVPGQAGSGSQLLSDKALTSWTYLWQDQAGASLTYYAQPDDSTYFQPPTTSEAISASAPNQPFPPLDYLEIPATQLPAPTTVANDTTQFAFALAPYAGAQVDQLSIYQQLETEVLSRQRRDQIQQITQTQAAKASRTGRAMDATIYGTTPQGLLAQFTADLSTISQLQLAINADQTQWLLENIPHNSDLWSALQTNQLFLVISDPEALKSYLSSSNSTLNIDNWLFQLDPALWQKHNTILIFKFSDQTVDELSQQVATWSMANAFNADNPGRTSQTIQEIIQQAIGRCCPAAVHRRDRLQDDCLQAQQCADPDFANFVYNIVLNPNWNGILALNAFVPLDKLPEELQGLSTGIDPHQFFAHHVGINANVVQKDQSAQDATAPITLKMQQSSLFGLIAYDDDQPLAPSTAAYQFKVLSLRVLFENSAIARFASTVDLQVNVLFGVNVALEAADPTASHAGLAGSESDNNVLFDGVYQNHDGTPSYLFTTQQAAQFGAPTSQVLQQVILDKGQFVTLTPKTGSSEIKTRFVFWGGIDFEALPGFDLFSFGSDAQQAGQLGFSNLSVNMDFDLDNAQQQNFMFDVSHMAFDLSRSQVRPTSLYNHFPLKLTAFTGSAFGTTPDSLGYMSVTSPLNPGLLGETWYGLEFELELGSLGALAGQGTFVANVLAAWSPAPGEDYNVVVGLKLPGSNGEKREITLQGPLKIKMKNIEFYAVPDAQTEAIAYLLRLQTITLGFFSLSFPPSGRTDFLLFGDPNSTDKKLGWYAVYDKGGKPKPKKPVAIPGFDSTAR